MGALTKTKIFLDESLGPEDQQRAADLVHQLDGEIVPVVEFDSCQVCVATEDINITRYRMFSHVKIPVVSMAFILDCFNRNMFCPPCDYAITKMVKSPSKTKINDKIQDVGNDDDEVAGAGASQDLVDRSRAQYQLKQNSPMKIVPKEVIPLPSFQIYVPPPLTSPADRRRSERILERDDDDDEACDSVQSTCAMQIFRTKSWPPEGEKDFTRRKSATKTLNEKISKSTAALLANGNGNEKRGAPATRGKNIFAASRSTSTAEKDEYVQVFLPGTLPNANIIALPAATTRLSKRAYDPENGEVTQPAKRTKGDKPPYFAFAVKSRQNEGEIISKSMVFKLHERDNRRKPIIETPGVPYKAEGINYFRAFEVVKPGNYVLEVTADDATPFLHEFAIVSSSSSSDSIRSAPANQATSTGKRKYTKRNSVEAVSGFESLLDDQRKDVVQAPARSSSRSSRQSRSSLVGSSILSTIPLPPETSVFLSKAKVILTAFDAEEDKVELLGEMKKHTRIFRVFDSQDVVAYDDLTHIVVPENTTRGKTPSILMAICKGIPIVTEKWVHACIDAKAILPHTHDYLHELYAHHVGSTQSSTIFTDKLVYVLDHTTSSEVTTKYVSKQHIELVIVAAGGSVVASIEDANYIVCENFGDIHLYMTSSEPATNKNQLRRDPIVTFKYVSECVAAGELIDSTEYSKSAAAIMAEYEEEEEEEEKGGINVSPSRLGRIGTPDSPSFY